MTEVADPQPYDNRFYHGRDGSGNLIAKSLVDVNATDEDGKNLLDENGNQIVIEGLRTVWKNSVKETAGSLLAVTDWYVIRKAEDSTTTIPSSVTTYRAAVRTKSGQIEAAIDGASDIAAFAALFDAPVDSNGNPTNMGFNLSLKRYNDCMVAISNGPSSAVIDGNAYNIAGVLAPASDLETPIGVQEFAAGAFYPSSVTADNFGTGGGNDLFALP